MESWTCQVRDYLSGSDYNSFDNTCEEIVRFDRLIRFQKLELIRSLYLESCSVVLASKYRFQSHPSDLDRFDHA